MRGLGLGRAIRVPVGWAEKVSPKNHEKQLVRQKKDTRFGQDCQGVLGSRLRGLGVFNYRSLYTKSPEPLSTKHTRNPYRTHTDP